MSSHKKLIHLPILNPRIEAGAKIGQRTMDAAFSGFKALPAPDQVMVTAPQYFTDRQTESEVKRKFRELSKTMHPDHGGTHEQFTELVRQYRQRVQ
jgi:hypothetical protein